MENLYHYPSSTEPEGSDFGHDSSSFVIPWPSSSSSNTTASSSSSAFHFCGFPNSFSIPIKEEDKASAASKSHSQAEKRRRDRINAQLSTLRKLIPKSDKMDKAALLESVIERVKDLKRKALEIGESLTVVPSEVDEIIIDNNVSDQDMNLINNNNNEGSSNNSDPNTYIRASVCCEDRPGLFSELVQALNGLRLTAVRADVASIGGRIKSVLILSSKGIDGQGVCVNALRHSLKLALTKIASQSISTNCRVRSKRQRFFLPSSHCTDHHHQ